MVFESPWEFMALLRAYYYTNILLLIVLCSPNNSLNIQYNILLENRVTGEVLKTK